MPTVRLEKDQKGWWKASVKWSSDRVISFEGVTVSVALRGLSGLVYLEEEKSNGKDCE